MKMRWDIRQLGDLLEVQNGYAFDAKLFNPTEGMPLVRIRSLKAGVETETRYSGIYDNKYIVRRGDLLVGMDGEFGCYEWLGEPSLLNQRVCRLQNFSADLVPRFLLYGVNRYLKAIEDVTGYSTVKHLSSRQIKTIEFPVPPLSEQHRIVEILDNAFADIAKVKANAEQNLRNARELFENQLQSVFNQGGSGWVQRRLGDKTMLEIIDGDRGVNYPKTSDFNIEGHCLFLTTKNVRPNGFNFESAIFITAEKDEQLRNGKLQRNDVVMTTRGTIGNIGLYSDDISFKHIRINSGMLIFRPNQSALLPVYLFELLRSHIVKAQIREQTTGAAQPQLPVKTLVNLVVPVPTALDEQFSIVRKVRALEPESQRLARIYERKLVELEALKKSILHKAFSGEL